MKNSIFSFFGGFVMYGFFPPPRLRQNNGERVVFLYSPVMCVQLCSEDALGLFGSVSVWLT